MDDDLQLAVDRFIGVDDKVSKWGDVLDVDMFASEDVILKCGSINWIIRPKEFISYTSKHFTYLLLWFQNTSMYYIPFTTQFSPYESEQKITS